jgi:F-type H+-transporting ATPase subunit b
MSQAPLVRRIALGAMGIVTAVSVWAWAVPARGDHGAERGTPRAMASGAPRPAHERPARTPEPKESQAAETEAAEEEAPGSINWADFSAKTPPFLAVLINFGILVGGYFLLGKKPIAAALENRRDAIAKDIEEAQRAKLAAEERAKIYQAKLERLEDEVRAARDALLRAGEAERDRIVADAEAKADRLRSDAQFLVEQELKQVRQDLWRETVEAAIGAAHELLASRVTAADQERLAEDYLADLGAQTASQPAEPRSQETAS